MDTWSPLFSSIVGSSIWGHEPHVKIVWITMIAMKDRTGFVESSVSGLARLSVVSPDQCREALAIFEAPDADSKCKEDEGRKIRTVPGGWLILGHERFQAKMKEVSTAVNNAKRQKAFRERSKVPASQDQPASPGYKAAEASAVGKLKNWDVAGFEAACEPRIKGDPSTGKIG